MLGPVVVERPADGDARVVSLSAGGVDIGHQSVAQLHRLEQQGEVAVLPDAALDVGLIGGVGAEDGGKHAELHPAQVEFGIVRTVLHVAAQVVTPVAEAHVGGRCREVGLPGQRGEIAVGIAREAYRVAVATQSAPAVVDERTAVGAVQPHVVVEHVVAPERLAQSLEELAREVLLPVNPPEVHSLTLAGTQDAIEHGVIELPVAQVPGHALHVLAQAHVLAHVVEEVLIVVYTVGRMQVQRHLQPFLMHEVDESLGVGNDRAVPGPARPALGVPVHVEYHHVHRNLVLPDVGGNLLELDGRVALVLAVPIAQHVERRHGLPTGNLREVAQCLAVLMAVAEEVPVDGLFVHWLSHPGHAVHIAVEGKRRGAVAALRAGRLVDDAPSRPREQSVLQCLLLVGAVLAVEGARGAFQVLRVLHAGMPRHGLSLQFERHAQRLSIVGIDGLAHFVAQRQRVGGNGEPAALFPHLIGRHGQFPVDHGKRGAVFKLPAIAVLNADHLGREHREARTARRHNGLGIGHGVGLILRAQRQQGCQHNYKGKESFHKHSVLVFFLFNWQRYE